LTLSKAITSSADTDTVICQESTSTFAFVDGLDLGNRTLQGEDVDKAVFDAGDTAVQWIITDATLKTCTFRDANGKDVKEPIFRMLGADLIVTGCIFEDNDSLTDGAEFGGLFGNKSTTGNNYTMVFTSCIFDNNLGAEIFIVREQTPVTIDLTINNCTFYWTITGALFQFFDSSTSTVTMNNCICFAGTTMNYTDGNVPDISVLSNLDVFNGSGFPSVTNGITTDPLLVDPENDDFHLRPGSPCIDTGIFI